MKVKDLKQHYQVCAKNPSPMSDKLEVKLDKVIAKYSVNQTTAISSMKKQDQIKQQEKIKEEQALIEKQMGLFKLQEEVKDREDKGDDGDEGSGLEKIDPINDYLPEEPDSGMVALPDSVDLVHVHQHGMILMNEIPSDIPQWICSMFYSLSGCKSGLETYVSGGTDLQHYDCP